MKLKLLKGVYPELLSWAINAHRRRERLRVITHTHRGEGATTGSKRDVITSQECL